MMKAKACNQLPPGFRFHPTDEELITYYLQNQAKSRPCPVSIIPEIDIYKFDPWELPEKSESVENEWYFFTPRDRKYPNGARPNRAAVSGYWKATGTDKAIHSGSKYVGVKKSLVFYKGKPPKGIKTDWIMHEYRLTGKKTREGNKRIGSMRLDDWVLCRIYNKRKNMGTTFEQKVEDSHTQIDATLKNDAYEEQKLKIPRTFSLSHLLEVEYMVPLPQLLSDNSYHQSGRTDSSEKFQLGDMTYPCTDFGKFQLNRSGILQQPLYLNPSAFDFQS